MVQLFFLSSSALGSVNGLVTSFVFRLKRTGQVTDAMLGRRRNKMISDRKKRKKESITDTLAHTTRLKSVRILFF